MTNESQSRVGPPSPRSEPWPGEIPTDEQIITEHQMYVRRDNALTEFVRSHAAFDHNAAIRLLVKTAFHAGWAARKKAQYEMALGVDSPAPAVTERIR